MKGKKSFQYIIINYIITTVLDDSGTIKIDLNRAKRKGEVKLI